jgi:hypothetical protein
MNKLTQLSVLVGYILLTIVVPWAAMFWTFGWQDGWLFIGLYNHLFLFPLLFGVVMLLMALQMARAILLLPPTRPLLRYAIAFSIVATLVAGYYEFEGKPAVFELAADTARSPMSPASSETFIDYLRQPTGTSSKTFLEKIPNTSWFFFSSAASPAKYAYAVSFILQTFMGICLVLLFSWSAKLAYERDRDYMRVRKPLIALMLWLLILFLPWLVMRITFEGYKETIYPGSERPSVILATPFIGAALYLAAVNWKIGGEILDSAVGLVSAVGITSLFTQENWREALFPRTPSFRHYLLMWLVINVMLFCFLVPYQPRKRRTNTLQRTRPRLRSE